MISSNRRVFMMHVVAGSSVFAAGQVMAQAKVEETDANAAALGYKADTTKVDAKKFPKHAVDQKCGTCALYQGKAGDATGACPLFAGKVVAAGGWCSAWAKKA